MIEEELLNKLIDEAVAKGNVITADDFKNFSLLDTITSEAKRKMKTALPKLKKSTVPNKLFSTIDLFAGVGGIRLGFESTGAFQTVFSNDIEEKCKITYDSNFKESKLHIGDLKEITNEEIPDFDFLLAGFPCQAFSVAGYREGFADSKGRGDLFFEIARIIEAKQPEGFLLENVKNLESHDKGRTFEIIVATLKELGYSVKHKVLNTKDYGRLPQNRERIYIVGFKDEKKSDLFRFPEKVKTTKEVKSILQELKNVDEKYIYNDKALYERICDEVIEENVAYQWRRKYVRKNQSGVFPTLTANMGMGGHNVPIVVQGDTVRKITPRECARLQGFPDSYVIPKELSDSAVYKQFGNSVSVTVLKRIAEQILKVYDECNS